jgi:hypothetical protein
MAYLKNRPTRGYGLLEPLLAKRRASIANRFIPEAHRNGRILDIGCGSFPYFLSHTFFKEKFAVEQQSPSSPQTDINWYSLDLNTDPSFSTKRHYQRHMDRQATLYIPRKSLPMNKNAVSAKILFKAPKDLFE